MLEKTPIYIPYQNPASQHLIHASSESSLTSSPKSDIKPQHQQAALLTL